MIETNYVPIFMNINHIFFVIKGQFPVMDTVILYIIVQCIYNMYALISYVTCEWSEMYSFQ